jgi:hypothetical protein
LLYELRLGKSGTAFSLAKRDFVLLNLFSCGNFVNLSIKETAMLTLIANYFVFALILVVYGAQV